MIFIHLKFEASDKQPVKALINRREMMQLILKALTWKLCKFGIAREVINCHHNSMTQEFLFDEIVFVTRKGTIRASSSEFGSMGNKSYIVRGKYNPQSFCFC